MASGRLPIPDTVYAVEFLAGNTTVSVFLGTGPEGAFFPFQLTFDSTGSPFFGQALQFRLSSGKSQTAFDDIQLDVITPIADVPEPSTLFLVATGVLGSLS